MNVKSRAVCHAADWSWFPKWWKGQEEDDISEKSLETVVCRNEGALTGLQTKQKAHSYGWAPLRDWENAIRKAQNSLYPKSCVEVGGGGLGWVCDTSVKYKPSIRVGPVLVIPCPIPRSSCRKTLPQHLSNNCSFLLLRGQRSQPISFHFCHHLMNLPSSDPVSPDSALPFLEFVFNVKDILS